MALIKKVLLSLVVFFSLPFSISYSSIRVGTVISDPPYVTSLKQGFEVELMQLLCLRMNEQCDFVTMDYYALFTALDNHQIDLAFDGVPFYIPPNSLNGPYIFSSPYLSNEGQFLVLRGSKIKSVNDLPLGGHVGLIEEKQQVTEGIFYQFFSKKYGSKLHLKIYADLETLIAALSDGNIPAAFLDNNEANYWKLNSGNKFNTLGKPMKVADGIGIVASPKNGLLIKRINQQLKQMQTNEAYIHLYNNYFEMGS